MAAVGPAHVAAFPVFSTESGPLWVCSKLRVGEGMPRKGQPVAQPSVNAC